MRIVRWIFVLKGMTIGSGEGLAMRKLIVRTEWRKGGVLSKF